MASLVLKMSCVFFLITCAIWLSEGQSCRQCCPQYWMRVDNYCYRYFGSARRWHHAHTHCALLGANLPSIHNRTEEVALYRLWKGLAKDPTLVGDAYWIGLHDTLTEDRFMWTDGTSTDYTNWRSEEPNDYYTEDCVEVRNKGYDDDERMKWNDKSCDHYRSFFCRKPLLIPTLIPTFQPVDEPNSKI